MKRMIKNSKIFPITKNMKKLFCIICGKYRQFEKSKISYFLEKTVLSIICKKCKDKDEKILKEEESNEILKILGWKYSRGKHKSRLTNIDETRNI